jgi:hypothetical protein
MVDPPQEPPALSRKALDMAAKRHRPNRRRAESKPRSEQQKQRRKELWLAREADRRTAAQTLFLARYEELKLEMARHGQTIGTLADALKIEDLAHRFEVIKARVERWDALWSITLRKRDTRGKIILGGAILAELAFLDPAQEEDREFRRRLIDVLDQRVLRIRDRLLVRDLLTAATRVETPLPLRPGGELSENLHDALAAIGETYASFDDEALRMAVADPSLDAQDDDEEFNLSSQDEPHHVTLERLYGPDEHWAKLDDDGPPADDDVI